jgi:hypothetical protein
MRAFAVQGLACSLAYLAALVVVNLGIDPATRLVFGDRFGFVILIFLPHGVKVMAGWLLGWRSVPMLAPGFVLGHFVLFPGAPFVAGPVIAALYLANAMIAFELFARSGFDLMGHGRMRLNWRGIVLVGAIASALSTLTAQVLLEVEVPIDRQLRLVLQIVAGDVAGLVVLMLGMLAVFRRMRPRG